MIRTYSSYLVRCMKQGCDVVSCTIFSYWGACWPKLLVLISHHMYVREDCCFWFLTEFFPFFSKYLVVGNRYDFFCRFQCNSAQHMPVGFCSIPNENMKTSFRVQGNAAVRQIASMNHSYGYSIVNCVWPRYSSISQLAGNYCNMLAADAGWRRIWIYVGQITIYASRS